MGGQCWHMQVGVKFRESEPAWLPQTVIRWMTANICWQWESEAQTGRERAGNMCTVKPNLMPAGD